MIHLDCDPRDVRTLKATYEVLLIKTDPPSVKVLPFTDGDEARRVAYAHKSGAKNYTVALRLVTDLRVVKELPIKRV